MFSLQAYTLKMKQQRSSQNEKKKRTKGIYVEITGLFRCCRFGLLYWAFLIPPDEDDNESNNNNNN
jgi:hypothetical protein